MLPNIGDTITFRIGFHTSTGTVVQVRPVGSTLLVQIAPEIFEIVYAHEVVEIVR